MIRERYAAAAWWRDLQPTPEQKGNRGALARLRRCASVAEAMQEPVTIQLFQRVRATGHDDLLPVALTAAVLAHVREDLPNVTVARSVGPPSPEKPEEALNPEKALLKPMRFRRLLEADGCEERLTAFRRLVALAGGKLPVADLAAALLEWSEERRRRWIYDYWNAGQQAAAQNAKTEEPVT
jgi:CRISPR system Cascade subunit CasB